MFQNFIVAFEAVVPMFLTISSGYCVKAAKILDQKCIKQINKLLFKILFPCVVICSLYGASVREAFDSKLISYSISIAVFMWIITIPIVKKLEKNDQSRGAMIQAINRSNFLVVGFPIVSNICGKENIASATLTIVGMLLVNNIMSVIILEIFRGGRPKPLHVIKEILINPIIIATFAGAFFMIAEIKLPYVIEATLNSVSDAATPLALIILGASLDLGTVGERKRNLLICIVGKLIVVPAIVTFLGMFMGFRGVSFVTLLAFFAASPTTTSYTMADQMNSDSELARDSVIFSTALVAFTMFCWILLFKSIGMF